MSFDCLLKNARLVIPHQGIFEATVGIKGGVIVAIYRGDVADVPTSPETTIVDVGGRYVLPGVIEPHSHFGRGSQTEDYVTETWSAALGGVTSIFIYYSRPHSYHQLFSELKPTGEARAYIDFAYHFGVRREVHLDEMEEYVSQCGVRSFKFLMAYKGEEGKAMALDGVDDGMIYEGFARIAAQDKGIACVHAENSEVTARLKQKMVAKGMDDLVAWADSRPNFTESEAIQRAYFFGKVTGCPTYIVHLSTKEGLDVVREWKQKLNAAYAEVCTHHLTHTKYAPEGKVIKSSPPLRGEEDVEALWAGLADGSIDTVGSDHVAFTKEQKMVSIWESPSGFPGTGTMLPVLLSEGVNKRGLSLERVAEVTSYNAAKIFNLYPRKGTIQVGSDADFTVIDLDVERTVRGSEMGSYSDISLYEGRTLKGWPVITIVRGEVVMQDGKIVGEKGHGRYLSR